MKPAAGRSFTTRLTMALALLLLAYGALVALLGRHVASEHEQESLQRLSHGLARHIVEHWPQMAKVDQGEADRDQADRAARDALMSMLMVVNPGVQVYVLDADGRVNAYIGEPGMVRQHQVDLNAVRAFLGGAALPLRGTDPMGSGLPRIFSAAMFAPRDGDVRPPGYLYVVLDGQPRDQVAGQLSLLRVWQGAGWAALAGLLVTLTAGVLAFQKLTQPLRRLASGMRDYKLKSLPVLRPEAASANRQNTTQRDEVRDIADAYAAMTQRLEEQTAREQEQSHAHRETMAGVAHDLRTPLTALHGHLETLALPAFAAIPSAQETSAMRHRVLNAALAQSNKVRRLSQQLFELATLQSTDDVLHRERFNLDELLSDAVQKFEVHHLQAHTRNEGDDADTATSSTVTLSGQAPGRMELNGDLHLIERAITNLIDNAVRHSDTAAPVRVSLTREGLEARIVVEDGGPGLPVELTRRLDAGLSVREPPIQRPGGGIGGLGLAIAQRVAVLHGGSLQTLPTEDNAVECGKRSGTRMCLALPLAA
jgi:signal transduction histidine kinase